jgi:hypothetical protein
MNSVVPAFLERNVKMSDPAKPDEPTSRALGADPRDSVEKAPTIGVDEAGSKFIITHNGAAASYFKGQWQPGIIFEGKDLINFNPITDPNEVETLMNQAGEALTAFLEQHKA